MITDFKIFEKKATAEFESNVINCAKYIENLVGLTRYANGYLTWQYEREGKNIKYYFPFKKDYNVLVDFLTNLNINPNIYYSPAGIIDVSFILSEEQVQEYSEIFTDSNKYNL